MPELIEEILVEIFCAAGKIPSKVPKSKIPTSKSDLVKFMLSGKLPLKVAFDFFQSATSAVLSEKSIEIFNNKGKSAVFGNEICQILPIAEMLRHKIEKLKCQNFTADFFPFWDLVKNNIRELHLSDVFFCDQKLMDILRNFRQLQRASIFLGVYCLTFIEDVVLFCPELLLKVLPLDQIENEKFENTRQPNVKNLTIEGHYASTGIYSMSLKRLIRKLEIAFPHLEHLKIIIEDDGIENENAKDIIRLISKPLFEETFDLVVVCNFAINQHSWKNSYFYTSLMEYPNTLLIETMDTSECWQLKISDKRLLEINLSSSFTADNSNFESPPSPKRRRL